MTANDPTTRPEMTDDGRRRVPTISQPLNAAPRSTVGPALLTLVLVAGIVGILALTIALTSTS